MSRNNKRKSGAKNVSKPKRRPKAAMVSKLKEAQRSFSSASLKAGYIDAAVGRLPSELGIMKPGHPDSLLRIKSACLLEDYTGVPASGMNCVYTLGSRRPGEPASDDNPQVFILIAFKDEDNLDDPARLTEDLGALHMKLDMEGVEHKIVHLVVIMRASDQG
jgi:hypothetical protein